MKSALNGRWLHASYLFAPTVVLLDEGFQPIRSEDIGLCEHMGWSDETTGAFGSVEITNKKARYLLVYSSARAADRQDLLGAVAGLVLQQPRQPPCR